MSEDKLGEEAQEAQQEEMERKKRLQEIQQRYIAAAIAAKKEAERRAAEETLSELRSLLEGNLHLFWNVHISRRLYSHQFVFIAKLFQKSGKPKSPGSLVQTTETAIVPIHRDNKTLQKCLIPRFALEYRLNLTSESDRSPFQLPVEL